MNGSRSHNFLVLIHQKKYKVGLFYDRDQLKYIKYMTCQHF
jgi:hypothetical protein